ncbi:MAG: tetratricopeptide repeat protein [Candidatus Binatia bacterium]
MAVVAAAVYLNALANGLVWDDPIVLTRQLLAFRSVRDLIFMPRNIPQFSPDYYRPLTTLSYLLDRAVAGASPFMFHLSVVVWHVINTYLVFRLGLRLFRDTPMATRAAGLGAACFAVHPIHTESVAWGAGRSDVIACVFSLGATLVYLSDRRSAGWRATVAAMLAFVAVLAKETAVSLFVLLPVGGLLLNAPPAGKGPPSREPAGKGSPPYQGRGKEGFETPRQQPPPLLGKEGWGRPNRRAARRRDRAGITPRLPGVWQVGPFAVGLLLYLIAREVALGSVLGPTTRPVDGLGPKLIGAVGHYMMKMVLPARQSAYISDLPTGPFALAAIAVAVSAVIAGGLTAWRRDSRPVVFLLLWMGATLAPSLAIVSKIPEAPVAERYLYLPSVGYCLLLGYGAFRLFKATGSRVGRAGLAVAVGLPLCAGAVATVRRNAVWRSNLTLWQDTAEKNLTDGLPMRSLATAYQLSGDAAKATEYFRQALQRRNDGSGRFTIYNNLGSLALNDRRFDDAERYYRAALSVSPQAADALFNLAFVSLTRVKDDGGGHDESWKRERLLRARQLLEQAQRVSPLDPDIDLALGEALQILGDPAAARAQYEHALQLGLPPATESAVRARLAELR